MITWFNRLNIYLTYLPKIIILLTNSPLINLYEFGKYARNSRSQFGWWGVGEGRHYSPLLPTKVHVIFPPYKNIEVSHT